MTRQSTKHVTVSPAAAWGAQGDMVAISQRGPLDESEDIVEGVVLERAKR